MPIMTVKVGKARDVEQKQSFVETIGQLASSCINKSLEKDMENKKLADLQFVIMIHDGAVPLHWTAVNDEKHRYSDNLLTMFIHCIGKKFCFFPLCNDVFHRSGPVCASF